MNGKRGIRRAICLLIATLSLAGCQPIGQKVDQGNQLPVTLIASYQVVPAFTTPTTFAVRDQASWEGLWNQVTQGMYPAPALPQIDFTKNIVVFAAAGTKSTSGYSIAITSAAETSAGVTVDVTLTNPGSNCAVSQIVTGPVTISTIPRRDSAIGFSINSNVQSCS